MMRIKNKRGQSTVEYILLATAVVGVMILFLTKKDTGLQGQLTNSYNGVVSGMGDLQETFSESHPLTNKSSPAPDYTVKVAP